jgi:hypothetical protein
LDNPLRTPSIADFTVNNDTVSVPAGYFDVYTIRKQEGIMIAYAPKIANIVNIDVSSQQYQIADTILSFCVQGELISTSTSFNLLNQQEK